MPDPSVSNALRPWSALLLIAVAVAGCSRQAAEPEPVRAVRTMRLSDDVTQPTREFAAETRARTESRLSFRVAGKIVSREVELGQAVKAGQVLARLDPEDLRQAQEASRAAFTAAQANLEQAAADHQRFKELRDQGFISSAELERRATALMTAQALADQARAQAIVQRNQAAYTALVAAASGVVVGVDAEAGAVVAAGAPVLRLALDGPRDAVFAVPEDSLPAMRTLLGKGSALQVRIWGSATPVAATLRELAAHADPITRTFQAKADLGTAPVQLGQTAAVIVHGEATPGVYRLPLAAVVRLQDRAAVWVLDRQTMTVNQVVVSVRGAEGNLALIDGGLNNGIEVVTAGAHVLTPGQKVKLYLADDAAAAAPVLPLHSATLPRS